MGRYYLITTRHAGVDLPVGAGCDVWIVVGVGLPTRYTPGHLRRSSDFAILAAREHLHAAVPRIGHIHTALCVDCNSDWLVECTWLIAGVAPLLQELAFTV